MAHKFAVGDKVHYQCPEDLKGEGGPEDFDGEVVKQLGPGECLFGIGFDDGEDWYVVEAPDGMKVEAEEKDLVRV